MEEISTSYSQQYHLSQENTHFLRKPKRHTYMVTPIHPLLQAQFTLIFLTSWTQTSLRISFNTAVQTDSKNLQELFKCEKPIN